MSNIFATLSGKAFRIALDGLLPQECLLCGQATHGAPVCATCCAALPKTDDKRCHRCALPIAHGNLCGQCLRKPPAFNTSHAAFDYVFPLDTLIKHFKYRQRFSLTAFFAGALASRLPPDIDLLLPVPMHRSRLAERGFNHAVEIAKALGKRCSIPYAPDWVDRIRPTPQLEGMTRKQRFSVLRKAFACNRPLEGRRIAVVDDVMTTGATLDALARCLKAAGATHVENLVIARTPAPR